MADQRGASPPRSLFGGWTNVTLPDGRVVQRQMLPRPPIRGLLGIDAMGPAPTPISEPWAKYSPGWFARSAWKNPRDQDHILEAMRTGRIPAFDSRASAPGRFVMRAAAPAAQPNPVSPAKTAPYRPEASNKANGNARQGSVSQAPHGNDAAPNDIVLAARAAQRKWNVPASITIAQWMLESGHGKKTPHGSNNPFGIKAGNGQPFVLAPTKEQTKDGRMIRIMAPFRKFDSVDQAFDLHGKLLATSPHYAAARDHADDPDAYANALTHTYASDDKYGPLLISLMRQHDLYQYDQ